MRGVRYLELVVGALGDGAACGRKKQEEEHGQLEAQMPHGASAVRTPTCRPHLPVRSTTAESESRSVHSTQGTDREGQHGRHGDDRDISLDVCRNEGSSITSVGALRVREKLSGTNSSR